MDTDRCKLRVNDCSKHYGSHTALDRVTFDARDGEFLSILGPSGCGKTTLLRVLTGLTHPDTGKVYKDGQEITALQPHRRGIGVVFQNYALFENMTVLKNVSYALRFHPQFRGSEDAAARTMLEAVGMSDALSQYPAQLSGGQQQRVAIARTLVLQPDVILFDEPMAALDAENRIVLRDEIKKLQKLFSTTILYVTHDQQEAFSLSDRIMVMESGRIRQIDTPENLLAHPVDDFVRRFVGDNLKHHLDDLQRYLPCMKR